MDSHNRQEQSASSEDEDQNFARYMDENGVIGLEDGGLEFDDQVDLEEGDEEQVLNLDEGEIEDQDEDGFHFPESPSEGDQSVGQRWKFSVSQMPEQRRNRDFVSVGDTDVSSADHPSRSITLPSALGRRPPSRDQQLDMTEDEVDQGSYLGAWDGDEEENWNHERSDFLYNGSAGHGRLEEYNHTSAGEEQWNNLPGSPEEDYSESLGNQASEPVTESISPSSPPVPSTWDTKLFNVLNLSTGIEDETLPESLHTDSGDGSTAIPVGDHAKVTRMSDQLRTMKIKPPPSPSTPPRMQNAQHSNVKRSKHAIIAQYGRGQLNYPLPDFSKVGPRVRFPRDEEGYRPPQPRRPESQNQGIPALFKSPADIVREVLLSSTENPTQEPVIPATVPQEFKTPQQATELVHQLQEDYHKLLTKYAEAENTIDRLRLGAKVHLYSDPAKPSHSVQMGTTLQGSKVMEFTIPHAQMAAFSSLGENNVISEQDSGSPESLKLALALPDNALPGSSESSSVEPTDDTAYTLRSHLDTLHREVDLFEGLLHGRSLTPEEQQQAVRELRGSLDVLERRYLQAQESNRQEQRHTGRPSQELDPDRELEEAIFQLGIQLDEFQERVDNTGLPNDSPDLSSNAHHFDNASVPSAVVPVPATQTPYPQVTSPEPPALSRTSMCPTNKEDPAEHLPQPLRHKHTQLERDYGTLLSTYSSFKSLPDALGLEQDEWPQQLPHNARPHDQTQDGSTQGPFPVSRSQSHSRATRPLDLMTPASPTSPQTHQDQSSGLRSEDQPSTSKTKRHSPSASQQTHVKSVNSQSTPPPGSPKDGRYSRNPSSGNSVTTSPKEQRRSSSAYRRQSTAPDERNYSAQRRMPRASKTFPQRLSLSSSLPQLKEQSPRTPTTELSASEESAQESPSLKSAFSKRNGTASGQRESPGGKGSIVQRRILSPETDSGFLGSESGRSPLLQKQRNRMSLNREDPVATPTSSKSPVKSERRLSKNGSDNFSRTHNGIHGERKQNILWNGQSEASSPSPGPKSLTDTESRGGSHTDDSDSERERSTNVGDTYGGISPLLSRMKEPSQPLNDLLESRTARDQAIHNLQKEVSQLREHLENSLNRSPARGKLGKPAIVQDQHDDKIPLIPPALASPISRHGNPQGGPRTGHQWKISASHDHANQAKGGRGIDGAHTGSRYHAADPIAPPAAEQVTVPHCQRCQESERKKHVTMKTPEEDRSAPPTHPDCPLCNGKKERENTPRSGSTNGANNKHHRRCPHCQHWFMSHPPPVSYIHSPLVPYSPPVIYSTPPGVYVPYGYNVTDLRSSFAAASSPHPEVTDLDDLSYPLSRALEAAKELKVTSKRMCRSLTLDLSTQHSLRGSCLF
ncbi:microtubule organization protein AKNA [Hyperolius riggenbachi]|uniref:microtubule organization protein AKNA n=1 Tax=Hyperolius riggenbachi TaxID=752182 RepID=UPI0035A33AED